VIFFAGPLPSLYKYPNNFTNHSDYQLDYRHPAMETKDSQRALFPAFYEELKNKKEVVTIIEAPFLAMWRLNNFHLYQRHHGKQVKIGHTDASFLSHGAHVKHENFHLSHFVNLDTTVDLQKSGAEFVVIHKDLLNEFLHVRSAYPGYVGYTEMIRADWKHMENTRGIPSRRLSDKLITRFRIRFGKPYYEDRWVAVFRIQ
jgi:hypothetical protein